jgi:ketosteroid isomerase-like protein
MRFTLPCLTLGMGLLVSASGIAQAPASPRDQVMAAERAFAKTMADRDHTAFATFVAEDAVFFGNADVLRGRAAVADGWKRYFAAGTPAPFSWEPDTVEVAGDLALSSGPVHDPAGNRVGTFNSTWRRDPDGRWRVLFDKGCPPCNCK